MNNLGYRIHKLTIANFRGITDPHTLTVSGRHLFILGPNAFGKSTIVEAIRWCLFGFPPGQQEIEVRNTFYPAKTSEVMLDLVAREKVLSIQRVFSPGADRSRQTIRDSAGKTVSLAAALPQLTRLGHPTGTQVIFAAQHAAGRRQAEISDFSRVLYFYLGIERIPELLEKLRQLVQERQAQRAEMSKSIEAFLQELRINLSILQGKKDEIVKNPPWGRGQTPTKIETDRKVDNLLHEVSQVAEAEIPTDLHGRDKLRRVKDLNTTLASKKDDLLKVQLRNLQADFDKAQKLKDEWNSVAGRILEVQAKTTDLNSKENQLLGNRSLGELEAQLEAEKHKYSESELRSKIRSDAAIYLVKYGSSQCPVCENALVPGTLESRGERPATDPPSAKLDELEKLIAEIMQVRDELAKCRQSLAGLEEKSTAIAGNASIITGLSNPSPGDIEEHVQRLHNAFQLGRNQIENTQSEHDRLNKRIGDVEAEERFQYYQGKITAIEEILQTGIDPAREALSEYDNFLATAEKVGKLVLEAFDAKINSAVPRLTQELTRVYADLTAHPSYDGVSILKQPSEPNRLESGTLKLQVTSSRCQGQSFPSNVLNGQAARALQLVPYFVFSNYWREVMELDLILVDDPSESFDTSHLDHLMSVLKSVASHTQLVVASHESDRMEPLIETHFPVEERCVVHVKDFDPLKGPILEQQ